MNSHNTFAKRQAGSMLLEALVAILIFSMGVLGLVGLQSSSVKQSTDAKYRSEAGLLADGLIGKMWVSDKALLQTNFSSSPAGSEYTLWLGTATTAGTVLGTLPQASSNPPTVTFDPSGNGSVTITLNWQAPYEPTPHTYTLKAQIKASI